METVTFSQPVMFLQITEGLWSRCTPRCQGLRQAHAICQTDGKVAEWGILCWSTLFVFCVSHLDIVWKSHLYNLLLAATWNTGLCSKTHRRSGITLVIICTCGHQSLIDTIILIPLQQSLDLMRMRKKLQLCRSFHVCSSGGKFAIHLLRKSEFCLLHSKLIIYPTSQKQT